MNLGEVRSEREVEEEGQKKTKVLGEMREGSWK